MTFLRRVGRYCLLALACVSATAAQAESTAASLPPLKGYRTYSDPWRTGQEKYGFCEIPTDGSTAITELTVGRADLNFSSGGALTPDGYLGFEHKQQHSGQPQLSRWYRYDRVTFEEIESGTFDFFFSASALTYDSASGLIYCCVADFATGGFFFGSLDPTTMQLTRIADIGDTFWFAMAADGNGNLYAVDFDSVFIKIDPTDGSITELGPTSILTYTTGSMAIDPASGRCFWTVTPMHTFMGSLYEVDLATGDATAVCTFPEADEFTGIYFDTPDGNILAPGVPQDFKADFLNGSLAGKLLFTVPEAAEGVDGSVDYVINCTNGNSWTGTAAYGATAEVAIEVAEEGDYTFDLRLSNAHGTSPLVKCSRWIGFDMPEALAKPETKLDGKTVTISWEHPTRTQHNHVDIDPADLSYRVTRVPGDVLVGETASTIITETPEVSADDMTPYRYAVTAYFTSGSTTAIADPVMTDAMVFGTAPLPYFNDFADEEQMAHFTVIDTDADQATWTYSTDMGSAFAKYNDSADKDDWLISPAFSFEDGKHYILNLDVASMGEYNPETMEIVLLSDLSANSGVATILDPIEVTNLIFDGYRNIEARFAAPESGNMFVGIHAMSNVNSYYLYVDNFSLSAGIDSNAPAVPTDVAVVAAEDGTPSADITGLAPALTYSGAALSGTVDIAVYRDGEHIATVSAVAPGAAFKATDTPEAGRHIYRVQASNSFGGGETLEIAAFVGVNAPKAPDGIVMFENTEMPGRVHLGWQAPTEDIAGQPLDQASLRYAIVDLYGNIVAENLEDCSFIVDAMPMGVERMFARFAIYAINEVGISPEPGYTAMIPIGFPYEDGWKESFADGTISSIIASDAANITDDAQWAPTTDKLTVKAADGDNGFVAMHAGSLGLTADLITPKCTVGAADYLAFAWHGTAESTNTLQVYAMEGDTPALLGEIATGTATGWQAERFDLGSYRGKDVYFIFRGKAVSHPDIYLDCLSMDSTSGIGTIGSGAAKPSVTTGRGWLEVSGTGGAEASVFTADGRQAATIAEGNRISLSPGVYIVRCGTASVKAVVR